MIPTVFPNDFSGLGVYYSELFVKFARMRLIELNHPWQYRFMCSLSTNGVLYFEPDVQAFIDKHYGYLSMSITVDGNKELHDMCRLDYDGKGSYDRAHAALMHWQNRINIPPETKITIAPGNISMMADALIEFATSDTPYIHCNYVYEDRKSVV